MSEIELASLILVSDSMDAFEIEGMIGPDFNVSELSTGMTIGLSGELSNNLYLFADNLNYFISSRSKRGSQA